MAWKDGFVIDYTGGPFHSDARCDKCVNLDSSCYCVMREMHMLDRELTRQRNCQHFARDKTCTLCAYNKPSEYCSVGNRQKTRNDLNVYTPCKKFRKKDYKPGFQVKSLYEPSKDRVKAGYLNSKDPTGKSAKKLFKKRMEETGLSEELLYSVFDIPENAFDILLDEDIEFTLPPELFDVFMIEKHLKERTVDSEAVKKLKEELKNKKSRLKSLRNKARVSQKRFATAFGVEVSTVKKWENPNCEEEIPEKIFEYLENPKKFSILVNKVEQGAPPLSLKMDDGYIRYS